MYLCAIVISLIISYFYATRKFNYWKKRGILFDKPIPYVGNSSLIFFKRCLGTYFKELYEKFDSPFVGFFLFDQPQLLVRDPVIIKSILIEDFHNFDNRIITSNARDDPLGTQGLFMLKNPLWKSMRQKMTVAFTSAKIKLMFPLMAEVGSDCLKYMNTYTGMPLDGKNLSLRYTTDVIASCGFGTKAYSFERENSALFTVALNLLRFTWTRCIQILCYFILPVLAKLFRMKLIDPSSCKALESVFWRVVEERRKSLVNRNDLVDIIIEIQDNASNNGNVKFGRDILAAQAIQFFLGGYETTSTACCYALYELAKCHIIQENLRKEILEVVEKFNGITYEGVQNMKYLDMVVHETVRKYPILPFLDRRARSDYLIPESNTKIEKGMRIFISTLGLHHDPNYFPDPEKFDPERFTPENIISRPNCVYLGFGDGPRNCIGARFGLLSIKMLLINILLEYEIFPCDETPLIIEFDPKVLLLVPRLPVKLHFKKLITS